MSLGDYLRLLRAKHGGVTPWDIEAATNLPKGLYRQMEQRYRSVGDEDAIGMLAEYYGTDADDLRWRVDWPRKGLSRSMAACVKTHEPITLQLWNGQTIQGRVRWWDLGAAALEVPGRDVVIVQRHAVERWSPRVEGAEGSEDAGSEADQVK